MTTAIRYHDICMGHRVYGHENKCSKLHGHNYRIHFEVVAKSETDAIGRVIDFSVIKSKLCDWLEIEWDHKLIMWEEDPLSAQIYLHFGSASGIYIVPFNPTAENIAKYLVEVIGPLQLHGTGCKLISCTVEETRKCSARYDLEPGWEWDEIPPAPNIEDLPF